MAPIAGQFDCYSAKGGAHSLTRTNAIAPLEGAGDARQQGHPAVAMVDDDNAVMAPERP